MGDKMTLWVAADNTGTDLVEFLKRKNLPLGIKYLAPVDDRSRNGPILFTSLGTFEGEVSIRRAVSAFE